MFNKYLYKTVPPAGIQRNQTYKKIKLKLKKKIDQNVVFTGFTNVLFSFYLWLRMDTFVWHILAECLTKKYNPDKKNFF